MAGSIPHNPFKVVLKETTTKTAKLLTASFYFGERWSEIGLHGEENEGKCGKMVLLSRNKAAIVRYQFEVL